LSVIKNAFSAKNELDKAVTVGGNNNARVRRRQVDVRGRNFWRWGDYLQFFQKIRIFKHTLVL